MISLILLLSLSACASKAIEPPIQNVKHEPIAELVNAEIDLDKIKTIADVIGVIKLFQPNPLPIGIKKDSVKDNKLFDAVKHLQVDKVKSPATIPK